MAKGNLSVFNKFILLLNFLAVAGLCCSYLASIINPSKIWVLGLFGLAYPILLIINILFIFYWLFMWKKWIFLSIGVILLGIHYINNTFQFSSKNELIGNDISKIKLMSFNCRLFDRYKWSKDETTREKIFRMIQKNKPDILCIQEFFSSNGKTYNNFDTLLKTQKATNFHIETTAENKEKEYTAIATFTKWPIVGRGKVEFEQPTSNVCIYTDLKFNNDTIRIYNVHLQSIRFQKEDYQFVKNITENKDQEEIQGSKKIIKRLKIGFIKRAKQVDMVAEHIKNSPYKVIIAGDFNDTPSSYTYNHLRGDRKDAFVESGWGIGNTYNGIFPSFRIDYILFDPKFSSISFEVVKRNLSDHFPIISVIGL